MKQTKQKQKIDNNNVVFLRRKQCKASIFVIKLSLQDDANAIWGCRLLMMIMIPWPLQKGLLWDDVYVQMPYKNVFGLGHWINLNFFLV